MKAFFGGLLAASLLAVPAAALAESARDQAVVEVKKGGESTKLVCKRIEGTGSRLKKAGKTTCLTAEEWEAVRRQTQDGVGKMQGGRRIISG